jgi:hypothetical protein
MGHEFTLRLSPSQGPSDAEQVFTCLEQVGTTTGKLLEVARSGVSRSYAFSAPLRSQWPEDFVVMVDSEEWYLNFHSATGTQQDIILQAITQCLHASGTTGTFEKV